jgi:hypothetical protein
MTTITTKLAGLGIAASLALLPGLAGAADYAYVNNDGEVQMVVASTWQTAIATAPNIALHSGVILIDGSADEDLLDDSVSGA